MKKIISSVFLLTVLLSSSMFHEPVRVSDQVILDINKKTITEYEFEKNLKVFQDTYQENYHTTPKADSLKKWVESFVEQTYLLSKAHFKKLDTCYNVIKTLEVGDKIIITQINGAWYNKQVKANCTISDQELTNVLEKANKKFVFTYLKFNTIHDLDGMLEGKTSFSKKDFNYLTQKSKHFPKVEFQKAEMEYPSSKFAPIHEEIFQLKVHQVALIKDKTTPESFFLVYVSAIDTLSNSIGERQIESIKKQLQTIKEYNFYDSMINKVLQDADVHIQTNKETKQISDILLALKQAKIDEGSFKGLLDTKVLNYKKRDELITLTFADFIEYYNFLPIKQTISSEENFKEYLTQYVVTDYLFTEAENMGLTKDKKFVLDRQNFKNKLILEEFNENLWNSITITNKEIEAVYNSKKSSFADGTKVKFSCLVFDTDADAFWTGRKLHSSSFQDISLELKDSAKYSNIKNFIPARSLSIESKEFIPEIRSLLFDMDTKEISRPIEINDKYYLFIKEEESGSRIKPLEEVKVRLETELKTQKMAVLKKDLLKKLKKEYTIINNIDYKKYLAKEN